MSSLLVQLFRTEGRGATRHTIRHLASKFRPKLTGFFSCIPIFITEKINIYSFSQI